MNTTAASTGKAAKVITMDVIKDRDWVRGGVKHEGKVREGHHAEIVVGKSITLHGAIPAGRRSVQDASGRWIPTTRPTLYVNVFHVGDVATYGGYNLTYMGRITAITAKTVSVVAYAGTCNEKTHRLSIERFEQMNWDFDAAEASERNANWMD